MLLVIFTTDISFSAVEDSHVVCFFSYKTRSLIGQSNGSSDGTDAGR